MGPRDGISVLIRRGRERHLSLLCEDGEKAPSANQEEGSYPRPTLSAP